MPSSILTGFLTGFQRQSEQNRQDAARTAEIQAAHEDRVLQLLASSDDPDIQEMAITGMLQPRDRRPKGFFDKLVGRQYTPNPVIRQALQLVRTPKDVEVGGDIPVQPFQPAPPQAPTGASAAMAPKAATEAGGGPSPGQLASPTPQPIARPTGGGAPLPLPQAVPPPPSLDIPVSQGMPAQAPTVPTMNATATVQRPRQIFLSADERMARTTMARTMSDLQAKATALKSLGATDEQIRKTLMFDIGGTGMREVTGGAGSGVHYQSVAGELPDGTDVYGVFDRTNGTYRDAATGQPLIGFRPRATTGSTSMGAMRESIARADYGKPFGELASDQQQAVITKESDLLAARAGATTSARAGAEATAPLSAAKRTDVMLALQDDWRKIAAPISEMQRQYRLMEVGLRRFREGDKIGGAQSVLVTFQKILDPQSVVRESEYARSAVGLSLLQRLQGFYERLAQGGAGVPDAELAGMVKTAEQFLTGMTDWNNGERDRIRRTAGQAGIDPSLILPGEPRAPGGGGEVPPPPIAPPAATATAPPPTTVAPRPGSRLAQDPNVAGTSGKYTGEVRKTADGRLLGRVGAQVVELVEKNGQYYIK